MGRLENFTNFERYRSAVLQMADELVTTVWENRDTKASRDRAKEIVYEIVQELLRTRRSLRETRRQVDKFKRRLKEVSSKEHTCMCGGMCKRQKGE